MASIYSLRIGISLFVRKSAQSLWENGIFQNCLFLAMLLQKSPIAGNVVLVAGGGDGEAQDALHFLEESPVAIIDMHSAIDQLDVMIELSAQLTKDWVIAFKAKGGKVVSMRVGNDYVIDIERMLFNKPPALLISGAPYDEVWTLSEYEKSCQFYFQSAFRTPVRIYGVRLFLNVPVRSCLPMSSLDIDQDQNAGELGCLSQMYVWLKPVICRF